ncbi:hypothetical protein LINGRAHAP2_LOCUS14202 [Linum grandiflorum]
MKFRPCGSLQRHTNFSHATRHNCDTRLDCRQYLRRHYCYHPLHSARKIISKMAIHT